jgi:hypothetical protein
MCKRKGRHVTGSFCVPSTILPLFRVFKNLRFTLPPPVQVPKNFDDEPRGPTAAIGPLRPPLSSIEKRSHGLSDISIHLRVIVTESSVNSITRAPTSSLPTGAPCTMSTEHDREGRSAIRQGPNLLSVSWSRTLFNCLFLVKPPSQWYRTEVFKL